MNRDRWLRVDAVFESALELPPAERAAFLALTCGEDHELHREVGSLLAHHPPEEDDVYGADAFLATPVAADAVTILLEGIDPTLIGKRLGHLEILRPLGEGGMGEVYLARDTRLQRQVAVKRIAAHLGDDPERSRRFRREALATSSLNHPNIVTVFEVVDFEGRDFLVTELIDGATLRQHRGASPMPVAQALGIVLQIARGLAAAHAVGVVHRDIKPENVMVRGDGLVKILDFGVAKSLQPRAVGDREGGTAATTAGEIVGTIAYMSPEQARGLPVDVRTDVWSLGVVLYELVSGASPFPGATPSDRLVAILERDPPPVGRDRGDIPAAIDEILGRALAKDAAARYPDGAAFVAALEPLVARASDAVAVSGAARSADPVAQPRRRQIATAVGIGALGIALIVTLVLLGRGDEQNDGGSATIAASIPAAHAIDSLAVLPLVNVSADPQLDYLSDGVTDNLIRGLAQTPGLRVISRLSVTRFRSAAGAPPPDPSDVGRQLNVRGIISGRLVQRGDRTEVEAELIDARDGTQVWSASYERPQSRVFEIQQDLAGDVRSALGRALNREQQGRLTRQSRNVVAYQAYLKGRFYWYRNANDDYKKSGDFFHRAVEADPEYALAWAGLSHYYSFAAANGTMDPAEAWPRAEDTARRAFELDPLLPDAYNTMAAAKLYRDRDWAAGEKDMYKGQALGGSPEGTNHLSFYLGSTGRFEEAIRLRLEVFESDPVSTVSNRLYGRTLYQARRFEEAIAQFRKTIDLAPHDADLHSLLGSALAQSGRESEAIAAWAKATRLFGDEKAASALEETFAREGFRSALALGARERIAANDARRARGEYVASFAYVRQYLRLGDRERALQFAEQAFKEPNRLVLDLYTDAEFDPLRDDPRFQAGIASLHLPAAD